MNFLLGVALVCIVTMAIVLMVGTVIMVIHDLIAMVKEDLRDR